jgi:hypothetical protein
MTQNLQKALDYIKDNQAQVREFEVFDYPDYAGLPIEISHKLFSDEVDHIQEIWTQLITNQS